MKDNRRKWEYTLEDIARAAGISIHTVRDHKVKGWVVPSNLVNISRYITGNRALSMTRSNDDEAWGGSDGKRARHG